MSWVLAAAVGWIFLAVVVAMIIGSAIRCADHDAARAEPGAPNTAADRFSRPAMAQAPRAPEVGTVSALGRATRASVHHARPAATHDRVPPPETSDSGRHTDRD